jgi:hypothetical protein
MLADNSNMFRVHRLNPGRVPPGVSFRILLAWLLAGTAAPVEAQWTMGARSVAMGQTHTALADDAWAVFHNPATLPGKDIVIGFFSIRYYGLRELEDHAAAISIPGPTFIRSETLRVAFGAGVHTYGFELFRETRARLALAAGIDRIRVGFSASYVHIRIQGYGSRGSPIFDAGIVAELTDSFLIGYRISHLLQPGDRGMETDLNPAEMAGGISWTGIRGLLVTADLIKDSLHPLSLRSGAEIELPGRLFIRGGWTSQPFTWSAGAGLQLDKVQGNLAIQKHEVLGLSPGFDIQLAL